MSERVAATNADDDAPASDSVPNQADETEIPAESDAPLAGDGSRPRQTKHWYRLAFIFTVVLVVFVVVALPLAVRSMFGTLFASSENLFYDLETGRQLTMDEVEGNVSDRTYLNIALTDLALDTGSISLVASGHRQCTGDCPELNFLLLSLDQSPVRRGLAPSATLQMPDAIDIFTEAIELPIDGNPSLYPFDVYTMKLAVAGYSVNAAGTPTPLTQENFSDNVEISIQDQIAELVMEPPVAFELPRVVENDDLLDAIAGQQIDLRRPIYLEVLTILLVLLIGISGILALLTRSIDDLLLGIGGLILGVWGIRSVMVPQPLPTLSVVDISLSGVILLLLIGLAIRAALHFHQLSELPTLRRFIKR